MLSADQQDHLEKLIFLDEVQSIIVELVKPLGLTAFP